MSRSLYLETDLSGSERTSGKLVQVQLHGQCFILNVPTFVYSKTEKRKQKSMRLSSSSQSDLIRKHVEIYLYIFIPLLYITAHGVCFTTKRAIIYLGHICIFILSLPASVCLFVHPDENDLGSVSEHNVTQNQNLDLVNLNLNPNQYWIRLELKGTVGPS